MSWSYCPPHYEAYPRRRRAQPAQSHEEVNSHFANSGSQSTHIRPHPGLFTPSRVLWNPAPQASKFSNSHSFRLHRNLFDCKLLILSIEYRAKTRTRCLFVSSSASATSELQPYSPATRPYRSYSKQTTSSYFEWAIQSTYFKCFRQHFPLQSCERPKSLQSQSHLVSTKCDFWFITTS